MRVAVLGVLSKPITTSSTGGTEVFCALLCQGLAQLGHEVYLFATPQSSLPGVTVIPVAEKTRSVIRDEYIKQHNRELTSDERGSIDMALTNRLLIHLLRSTIPFDVVHDNTSSFLTGASSDLLPWPVITTMHMPPTNGYMTIPPFITQQKNKYVAISQFQEKHSNQRASYFVYNGIDISPYTFDEAGDEPLIWIGRVSPNALKGLKEALIVTKELQRSFKYAANISDQTYYDQEIVPHLHEKAIDVGIVHDDTKQPFLAKAKAALFPIMWEEPFGFVFTEAMAVGTPVIAFARGAVPEIIQDGISGFIVNPSDDDIRGDFIVKTTGLAGIKEAVEKLYTLSSDEYRAMRQAARKRVEEMFTVETMVKGYENVYKQVISLTSS